MSFEMEVVKTVPVAFKNVFHLFVRFNIVLLRQEKFEHVRVLQQKVLDRLKKDGRIIAYLRTKVVTLYLLNKTGFTKFCSSKSILMILDM